MKGCSVRVVLLNSKDKEFTVKGKMWVDGSLFCYSPRPEKYPDFIGLVSLNRAKELRWVKSLEDDPGEESPFRVKAIFGEPIRKKAVK